MIKNTEVDLENEGSELKHQGLKQREQKEMCPL